MTAFQLLGSLPFMTLDAGCTITVEAISPTSGAAITGVTVSQVAFAYPGSPAGEEGFTDVDSYFVHEPGDT